MYKTHLYVQEAFTSSNSNNIITSAYKKHIELIFFKQVRMLNVKKVTKNVINNLFQLLNCITFMLLILLAAMNNLSLKQKSKWYLLYYYAKWVKSF